MFIPDVPFGIITDVDALIVSVRGELDMATAGGLEQALQQLAATISDGSIVVDLSQVGFIDSSGVRVLIEQWQSTRRVIIRNPRSQAVRVFALTGLDQYVPIEHTSANEPTVIVE